MLRRIWHAWKSLGRFMGNLVARLVLTVFYFTVFVPFGVGTSLLSDRLGIKSVPASLWQARETPVETLNTAQRQA